MTLRLILTRHAKSDWDDPLLDDHDRPLNPRGVASAAAMGAWLGAQGYLPEQALVSTATRAVQTWQGMCPALPGCAARFQPRLYHAAPDTILAVLATATAPCVMMIGHNPGFALLAEALVTHAPDHAQFHGFPTCATLVVDFDAPDWTMARIGSGRTVAFAVPREVM